MMEQTPFLVLTNIVVVFILYLLTKPAYRGVQISPARRSVSMLLILLFCLYSFWGKDWFGYLSYYEEIERGGVVSSLEDVYNWVGGFCPSYVLFRLVIWGPALFFFFKTTKRLSLDRDTVLFFFCSIYLIWFSYARVSLAMAVIFYGYSLMYSSRKRFDLKYIFGILLILASFYLHKSSIFAIVVVLASELLKRWGKAGIILPIIISPVAIIIAMDQFGNFVDSLVANEANVMNEYATAGNAYLNSDSYIAGPGVLLQWFFERAPYYLLSFICIRVIWSDDRRVSPDIKPYMLLLFLLVLTATAFLFDFGLNTTTLYGRFIRYAQIPACIVLSHLYTEKIYPKFTKFTCWLAIVGTAYSLLYVMYNANAAYH